jgi:hypothetical protein
MFGFKFASDAKTMGSFQITFPKYADYDIFEPQVFIPIDNFTLYAFSQKNDVNQTRQYRLVKMFDTTSWVDTFGAIKLPYSMALKTRAYYVGERRFEKGDVIAAIIYMDCLDETGLLVNVYADGTRLVSPCAFVQKRQSGIASDNTIRHILKDIIKGSLRGAFFEVYLSKMVPEDGNLEYFGTELVVDNLNVNPLDLEFFSNSQVITGPGTLFIKSATNTPEVRI